MLKAFLRREDGATAIEYALIVGILVLAIVTAAAEVGRLAGQNFDYVAEEVVDATGS